MTVTSLVESKPSTGAFLSSACFRTRRAIIGVGAAFNAFAAAKYAAGKIAAATDAAAAGTAIASAVRITGHEATASDVRRGTVLSVME